MLLALIILAVFATKDGVCTKCESLKNISVIVRTLEGGQYNKTVEGCIEKAAFDDVVVQAYVKNQTVRRLGKDSVRNMRRLHSVQFYRCQLEIIEPGAFRNVPDLRSVQIVSNELKRVSEGVFQLIPNLEILKMNRNKIDVIEDGSFDNVTTLKKVYLSHNQLKTWSERWFTDCIDLQVIDFQFNKIRILPRKAFYGLSKLKEIYFDFNELEFLGQEAFKGIGKLDYLGLKYNRLKSIDHKAFPDEIDINLLAIDANYLNFMERKVLDKINVKEISVHGNPWKCQCFDDLLLWLHATNATVKSDVVCRGENIPVCSFPTVHPKECTETIDEELTKTYLETLKKLSPPLDEYCARLD